MTRGGLVILLGPVASEHDRELAEQILRLEPSVSEVNNLLTVGETATFPAAPTAGASSAAGPTASAAVPVAAVSPPAVAAKALDAKRTTQPTVPSPTRPATP